jgi:hypothetical protein
MAFFDILFLVIAAYLLYKFVFNFLLPVMRVTHQVRQQFRNMQGSPNESGGDRQGAGGFSGQAADFGSSQPGSSSGRPGAGGAGAGGPSKGSQKPPADDYIDFEEVK